MIVDEFGEPTEEEDWRRLTREQFLAGYAEDASYREFAGTLRDDPLLDAWRAAMEAYRQRVDEETDRP
jgi:hypothetical protein